MQELTKTNDIEKEYFNVLKRIKESIRLNQNKAMVQVNSQMILNYYEIGTIINEKKTWGNKYIERLSNDLKEFGTSYSVINFHYMSQFANEFSKDEIMQQPVAKIPWRKRIVVKFYNSFFYYNSIYLDISSLNES